MLFRSVSVQDVAGGLLAGTGTLGRHQPDEIDRTDIARGVAVLNVMGGLDIGQGVVVQAGVVLGVEAIEGTDALIVRCGTLRRSGKGPVLVKLAKPEQEQRVDLPAIGPATIAGCAAAGFAGIAVEAGRSLIIDRAATIAAADEASLFLVGLSTAGD